jgi:TPR repeat protein
MLQGMIMRRTLLILIAMLMSSSATAELYGMEQISAIYDKEQRGVRAYGGGRFESAFEILSDTASKGMKESQYLLSLMFMKGEGINKSILIGLGWLGVAAESGNEEWNDTFDKLYESMNDTQRAMVDNKVSEYVAKYGMEVQGITCAKRSGAGSRRLQVRCDKVVGNYPVYEIETSLTR